MRLVNPICAEYQRTDQSRVIQSVLAHRGLGLSLTTAHFEEERPLLALVTGKVINSLSAISTNGNTCAFRFSDILPLCCPADVTYSFTTKLTL